MSIPLWNVIYRTLSASWESSTVSIALFWESNEVIFVMCSERSLIYYIPIDVNNISSRQLEMELRKGIRVGSINLGIIHVVVVIQHCSCKCDWNHIKDSSWHTSNISKHFLNERQIEKNRAMVINLGNTCVWGRARETNRVGRELGERSVISKRTEVVINVNALERLG